MKAALSKNSLIRDNETECDIRNTTCDANAKHTHMHFVTVHDDEIRGK